MSGWDTNLSANCTLLNLVKSASEYKRTLHHNVMSVPVSCIQIENILVYAIFAEHKNNVPFLVTKTSCYELHQSFFYLVDIIYKQAMTSCSAVCDLEEYVSPKYVSL